MKNFENSSDVEHFNIIFTIMGPVLAGLRLKPPKDNMMNIIVFTILLKTAYFMFC